MIAPRTINGSPFHYDESLNFRLRALDDDIKERRREGRLNVDIQRTLYKQTKLDELYHSNRIEGNRLTFDETRQLILEGGLIDGKPSIDQQETKNLSRALDYAQEIAFDHSRFVTQSLLREFHAVLMAGIEQDAGRYRATEVIIEGSCHVPPDAFLVPQFMTELSDYVATVTSAGAQLAESPVFCAALAHALFAQIHPFTDGNGRTARALMNLILRRNGYPPSIIPEDQRSRYIIAMEKTWKAGDLSALVELIHEYTRAL